MSREVFPKPNIKEKTITSEILKTENIVNDQKLVSQEEKQNNISLRKQKEFQKIEELRSELTQNFVDHELLLKNQFKNDSNLWKE